MLIERQYSEKGGLLNNIHIGYSNDVIIDMINGEYALYLRKSRADLEAEAKGEGETLARHEKMLIELARRYGFSIGKIYREIVSGESIESRPVVQELLRDVESGRWKGVLVVEVESFSCRSRKTCSWRYNGSRKSSKEF